MQQTTPNPTHPSQKMFEGCLLANHFAQTRHREVQVIADFAEDEAIEFAKSLKQVSCRPQYSIIYSYLRINTYILYTHIRLELHL